MGIGVDKAFLAALEEQFGAKLGDGLRSADETIQERRHYSSGLINSSKDQIIQFYIPTPNREIASIILIKPQPLFSIVGNKRIAYNCSAWFHYQVFKLLYSRMEEFLKLLIIGDSGVGKSCILSRFCQNKFTEAFYNTIGVDFKTKTLLVDGKKCKLQIWDTAGQERFRTITSNYYKGAHGILIVFDLTSRESLKNTSFWLQEIEKFGSAQSAVILIGNKNDLAGKRQVTEDEASDFAKKNSLDYIECSAFNALNISLVFDAIVKKVLRERAKKEKQEIETPMGNKPTSSSRTSLNGSVEKKNQSKKKENCC